VRLKTILKLALVGVVIFAGVKFGAVYVNKMQFGSVMSAEALDARREQRRPDAKALIRRINERVQFENIKVPSEVEFAIDGLDDPGADLVITANYTEVVDLYVHKVPMKMKVVGRADAPETK
jgi:hypothetical protein